MIQDLRLSLRMLRKQPGFAVIAVFTLALGIGATSAVFSLIRGVLLTPPPYRQPDRLVLIQRPAPTVDPWTIREVGLPRNGPNGANRQSLSRRLALTRGTSIF